MKINFSEDETFIANQINYRRTLYEVLRDNMKNGEDDFSIWLKSDENIKKFVTAWLDGYEIEEKKYAVKLIDKTNDSSITNSIYLYINGDGSMFCRTMTSRSELLLSCEEEYSGKFFFTEKEIKAMNPAYWELREEVPVNE